MYYNYAIEIKYPKPTGPGSASLKNKSAAELRKIRDDLRNQFGTPEQTKGM